MLTLIEAARAGDLEAIKAAIARGEDPKANDSVALSWAARGGHLECLRLLLPVSDPRACNSLALSWAAGSGHTECVRLLLPVSDPRDYSRALRMAAWKGHTECARLIEDAIAEAERADVKVKQQQAQETNMTDRLSPAMTAALNAVAVMGQDNAQQPDYRNLVNELESALLQALPFVECAIDDPCYKREEVRKVVRQIVSVLKSAACSGFVEGETSK